jgi:predicted dehydrogenase
MLMESVRFGIIGMGGIGRHHGKYLAEGAVQGATLTAFCTRDSERRAQAAVLFPQAAVFEKHGDLLASKTCDAVLIATPHFQHPQVARDALGSNLHVLVEKPLAVSVTEARNLVQFVTGYPHLRFGIMLNQRTHPLYQKIRELVQQRELGEITRVTWIATHWFRPWSYFRSSPWRATWKGEGGGVLINQCHHNLDLLCWIMGKLPSRVTAVGFAGKSHPIETEDEVSAILEYPGEGDRYRGAIGHLITSTGESPGVNRLEIAGTRARLVAENSRLFLTRAKFDAREFMRTCPEPFAAPETVHSEIPVSAPHTPDHPVITQDFVNAILEGRPSEKLLAPAVEGVAAVELGNALQMAALTRVPVELPLDGWEFDRFLEEKMGGAG